MRTVKSIILTLLVILLSVTVAFAWPTVPKLSSYNNVDINQTTVSGVSAGAFFATQFHVAFSNQVQGISAVAGGPYYCGKGDVMTSVNECFGASAVPTVDYIGKIQQEEALGNIDDPANLADDMVYIFTGSNDQKVSTQTVDALNAQYQHFTNNANIDYVKNQIGAGHSMVTDDYGNACDQETGEYINDCDYDQARIILEQMYGPLNAPGPRGDVTKFDQREFITGNSMDKSAFVYVPEACKSGTATACKVHVVFHGCWQEADRIGDSYYTKTGYNEWAETNNIIVLYPQILTSQFKPMNPQGCWDWWGYTNSNYHRKSGPQMNAVMNMVKRLAGQY